MTDRPGPDTDVARWTRCPDCSRWRLTIVQPSGRTYTAHWNATEGERCWLTSKDRIRTGRIDPWQTRRAW